VVLPADSGYLALAFHMAAEETQTHNIKSYIKKQNKHTQCKHKKQKIIIMNE